MPTFTLIGFYPDNGQRWADTREATDAEHAERLAPEEVQIVGVVDGAVEMADSYTHVRSGGEQG